MITQIVNLDTRKLIKALDRLNLLQIQYTQFRVLRFPIEKVLCCEKKNSKNVDIRQVTLSTRYLNYYRDYNIKIPRIYIEILNEYNLQYQYQMEQTQFHQYIIIGAGVSGIHAAQLLSQNQKDFIILEATNRVGGRICTEYLGQVMEKEKIKYQWTKNQRVKRVPLQLGATWISEQHYLALHMLRQFGMGIWPQYYDGQTIYGEDEGVYKYVQSMKEYFAPHRKQLQNLIDSIQKLSVELQQLEKIGSKKLGEFIKEYDNTTLEEHVHKVIPNKQLAMKVINEIQTLQCLSVNKLSMMQIIHQKDGLELINLYSGRSDVPIDGMRIKDGMLQLVNNMKKKVNTILENQKDNQFNVNLRKDKFIRFNQPVVEIINDLGFERVKIKIKGGKQYTCRKILCSVPLAVLENIKITGLSLPKKIIFQNQEHGKIGRYFIVFKEAFWRKKYCGYGSFSPKFLFNQITQLSPFNLACGIFGFIIVKGDNLKLQNKFKNQPNPKKAWHNYFIKIIADAYLDGNINHPALKQSFSFYRQLSKQEYIRAAYQCTTKPKIWNKLYQMGFKYPEQMIKDQNNIIFIGTQFSEEYATYIEGALRNTRKKIHKLLNRQDPLLNRLLACRSKL